MDGLFNYDRDMMQPPKGLNPDLLISLNSKGV